MNGHLLRNHFLPPVRGAKILLLPADKGAVGFYRVTQPGVEYAKAARLWPNPSREFPKLETFADEGYAMLLNHRQTTEKQLHFWRSFRERFPDFEIITDFDDLLWHPHPKSTYKAPPEMIARLDETSRMATRFIASTKDMAREVFKRYRKPVTVVPNMISRAKLRPIRKRRPDEKLRVLWAGSATHIPDLEQVIKAVQKTASRYEWWFLGYVPPELSGIVRALPWCEFVQAYDAMANVGAHVGIAPLALHPFNRCKSNLKLLEYGAAGLATIASDIAPYRDSPGHLVQKPRPDDWVSALDRMEDEQERLRIAEACQEYAKRFIVDRPRNLSLLVNAYGKQHAEPANEVHPARLQAA